MSDEERVEELLCHIDDIKDAIGLDYLAIATPIVQSFIASIRREACTALDEAISDLRHGFVSCGGYEEPSTTIVLNVYSMLKMHRAAIMGKEAGE